MYTIPADQRAIFDALPNKAKWAVARAYRTKRQEGCSDGPSRHAAILVLQELFPDIAYFELSKTAGVIIARAASDHGEWFWKGTSFGWPPPWMPWKKGI